jgi:MtN3 and saliva related transmembrane protein
MTTISVLATIFGTIMALANLPQAYKIFKTKSAKDISMITYSLLLAGAIVWILYGVERKDFPLIFANSIGVIAIGLVIFGWCLYGRKNSKKTKCILTKILN